MKLGGIGSIRPTTSRARSAASVGAGGDGLAASVRHVEDSARVLGIPEEELTPNVRDALMGLMQEVDQLRRNVKEIQKRLREAEHLADHDPLIPVLNRRAFVREIGRVVAMGRRYGETAGIVYLDIDRFKEINDIHGHAAGDGVLKFVASRTAAHIRDTDIMGRLGGDEIAVLLVHTDEKSTQAKARELKELIGAEPFEYEGVAIPVSVSVGATAFGGEDSPDTALSRADAQMYRDKKRLDETGEGR
ncbi:diguanylate cyclase (GGDEF)-like protein [Parvibaculum indicum]|uniref:GGDEF domain-containing protein n=1 Tax=Parvibaculum indicum TaxID=562969 RepID=UPI0014227D49|nr:GGDEF domain-containing protein [Parvibaculum indicum]NIJ40507.1 diguanylate cyclase (GGDEF)-like protein [Parvibaculum indicum]